MLTSSDTKYLWDDDDDDDHDDHDDDDHRDDDYDDDDDDDDDCNLAESSLSVSCSTLRSMRFFLTSGGAGR